MKESEDILSEDISRKLERAITSSLIREQEPRWMRFYRVFRFSLFTSGILYIGLWYCFRHSMNHWMLACGLWAVAMLFGFYFYFIPQPKIEVKNYWSSWIIGKLILLATFNTWMTLFLCPHFVVLHPSEKLAFGFLNGLPDLYMALGGMSACMFFCGFTFSLLSGCLSFIFISKTISLSSWRSILKPALISFSSLIPILIIQIFDMNLRFYFFYWLAGSLLGILTSLVIVSLLSRVFSKKLLN